MILLFDLEGMEKLYFDYRSIFKNTGAYTKTFISSGSTYDSCVYVIVVTFL